MHSLKFTSLNILKLNNKTYLPYQLHQLPKWFNKYNYRTLKSLKGYCYISVSTNTIIIINTLIIITSKTD